MKRSITAAAPCDLLDWLEAQPLYPKVYWQSREGDLTLAAVGTSLVTHEIPVFSKESSDRFYGGCSFCERRWDHFPASYFFVPRIEYVRTREESFLCYYGSDNESVKPIIPQKEWTPTFLTREDSLSKEAWTQQIERYLLLIENKELEKIVSARESIFTFKESLSPWPFLKKLKTRSHRTTLFGFQMNKENAFFGATPEKLYARQNREIHSDVLAATAPINEPELLDRPKEKREFGHVQRFIQNALSPLCFSLSLEKESLFTTETMHHLYSRLSGSLKEGITDRDLIAQLHPTPAVAGLPQQAALSLLAKHEDFARGWYAAPVGWISSEAADIAVGIRSARIQNNKLHLFAGAGIVSGSSPLAEWEEVEMKIAPLLSLLTKGVEWK